MGDGCSFANKQDISTALSAPDIAAQCELDTIKQCHYRVWPCSALPTNDISNGAPPQLDGRITEGLQWLFAEVERQWDTLSIRIAQDTATQKERQAADKAERLKR